MVDVAGWLVLDCCIAFMLILLLVFRNSSSRLKMGKMYSKILTCTLYLIFMDVIARFGDAQHYGIAPLVHIGIISMYILDPIDILFSVHYVDFWMDDGNKKKKRYSSLSFCFLL